MTHLQSDFSHFLEVKNIYARKIECENNNEMSLFNLSKVLLT